MARKQKPVVKVSRRFLGKDDAGAEIWAWHWGRENERGSLVDSSHGGDGCSTLSELLDEVSARFPDDEVQGIGHDEPALGAEGLR